MMIRFLKRSFIFLLILFIYSGCTSLKDRVKYYSNAKIIFTDCSQYKSKLDANNAKSMVTYRWDTKTGTITSSGLWKFYDNKSEDPSHELYKGEVERAFSLTLINVHAYLYKIYDAGSPYYKVHIEYRTPKITHFEVYGTMPVKVDKRNKIIVIPVNDKEIKMEFEIFGYFDEGFFAEK